MGMPRRAVALVIACALALGVAPSLPAHAASTAAHPVVEGNRLVDARTGATFVPRGANWPSFEYACWQGWGYSQGTSSAEAALIASWRINTVRIPLNQDCWLGLQGSPAGGGRTKEGYRTAVETWVQQLNAAGIVAILDLHSSAPAGYPAHGQRAMPDAQSATFWTSVATRFASNPSVMFDLFNEPYSRWNDETTNWAFDLTWQCWRDGGCQAPVEDDYTATLSGAKYSVTGMSALVAAVRAAGAPQPIMLGGRDYSNDLSQWLTYRPDDDQLVASWHNYPGQRCHTLTCWNSEITAVAAVVPVVAGEFGQTDGGNSYLTTFMTWAESHGVGYLPWAWWRVNEAESVTNSRYALIDDNDQPKAPAGTALHDFLGALPPDPVDPPPITVDRIAGADRFATSVEISRESYPGTAAVVYVATGLNYPDALSAGPAAAANDGPLLLTAGATLPAAVRAEIERLRPARIVVVGGPTMVANSVLAELRSLQPNTVRIAGGDRYETSRLIIADAFDTLPVPYIATGQNFPDALSAGAAAAESGGAVVLAYGNGTAVDAPTASLVRSLDPDRLVVVGGTPSVSAALFSSFGSIAPTERVFGANRYETSIALVEDAWTSADTVLLASGANFPDALAASAWAAHIGAPLIAVPPTCVPQAALDLIDRLGATRIVLIGGTPSLSTGVEQLQPC